MRAPTLELTGRGRVTQRHPYAAHDDEHGAWAGDCLRACVASIFDLHIEDVPHFAQLDCEGLGDWPLLLDRWCRARGWISTTKPASWLDEHTEPCIVGGRSPRASHVVVRCDDGTLWDPSPTRDGLLPDSVRFVIIFEPIVDL